VKNTNLVLFLGLFFLVEEVAFAEKQIVVGSDDTVYGIAYNNGIPTRALISANNLKPPYTLRPGQTLIVPASNEHIVSNAESLQSIAEDYGVKMTVLAQENDIKAPFFVSPGTRLSIPSRDTEAFAEALSPPPSNISSSSLAPLPLVKSTLAPEKSSVAPPSTTETLPNDLAEELAREKKSSGRKVDVSSSSKPQLMGNLAQKNDDSAATPLSDSNKEKQNPKKEKKQDVKKEPKKEEKIIEKKEDKKEEKAEFETKETSFIWPVKGEVISKFSPGGKNDGINIKVPEGTPVKAAADGVVMYAGNELKGFGNLLLIKHADGWVTAYAYNSALLVKKGSKIKQGQEVAKSGNSDAGEPQLHFEIRKIKQPIDPLTKLES
jgi:murein DD-endopeptidase MepM/ murein hydrolase activator NlpD